MHNLEKKALEKEHFKINVEIMFNVEPWIMRIFKNKEIFWGSDFAYNI